MTTAGMSTAAGTHDPPRMREERVHLTGIGPGDSDHRTDERPGNGGPVEAILVFFVAIAVRLPFLNHLPQKDELNHLLAARALLDSGFELVPGGHSYARAEGFTYLVAGMFQLFGESLVVGRIPALVFGALLVTVLFLWVRSEVGRVGAWFAAMLLAFAPISLELSQWVRFYTLYALLFLVLCLLIYRLLSPPAVKLWQGIALALGALAILYCVEPLTGPGPIIVGLAGLGLWAMVIGVPRLFRCMPSRHAAVWLAAGLVALASVAILIAWQGGFVERLMARASYAPLWGEVNRDNFRYYHDLFLKQYPLLWVLLPLAAVIAVASRRRAALLCICVFGVAFVAHSIAASKAERYLFYALPMFFALWGMAVGSAVPRFRRYSQQLLLRLDRPLSMRAYEVAGILILVSLALYPALLRPTLKYGHRLWAQGQAEWAGWGTYHKRPDWLATGTALAPLVEQADVIVASYDVTAIYGLGRIDYVMRRALSHWLLPLPEFAPGGRLWRPVFSTPESLSRVMACHATGLVFLERAEIHREIHGFPALVQYLETHAAKLDLPDEWDMIVYRWERSGPAPASADCASLPGPGRPSTINPYRLP